MKVAVIGSTSWGTTLGIILARRDIDVALWARTSEEADRLAQDRENTTRLPGIPFPERLSPTSIIKEALHNASLVLLAVPSQKMRQNVRILRSEIAEGVPIVHAAKGQVSGKGPRDNGIIFFSRFYQRRCCGGGAGGSVKEHYRFRRRNG
jgi:glycerol-3-phosphate dehydrogenase (NAD(P)+)